MTATIERVIMTPLRMMVIESSILVVVLEQPAAACTSGSAVEQLQISLQSPSAKTGVAIAPDKPTTASRIDNVLLIILFMELLCCYYLASVTGRGAFLAFFDHVENKVRDYTRKSYDDEADNCIGKSILGFLEFG